ncbi:hypothetical protein [Noviherbaspirillum sedimenti]|uniref:hypothetical protein n=1 Tax=Noviherbaspirillum sedimenti TaxID=2320865 RepID=UPI0011C3D2DB|nr:hypothetical protein [Noviherbaspirillum sedimenti]
MANPLARPAFAASGKIPLPQRGFRVHGRLLLAPRCCRTAVKMQHHRHILAKTAIPRLTIPITTAGVAVQSNSVYLPLHGSSPWLALLERQINSIR